MPGASRGRTAAMRGGAEPESAGGCRGISSRIIVGLTRARPAAPCGGDAQPLRCS
jgi:hypothetical protein